MLYTVTIKIAAPGTELKGGETSMTGHMWYSISDGKNPAESYGFSPIKSGYPWGKGQVTHDDDHYNATYYQRTMEVSKAQYDKLKEFGDSAVAHHPKNNFQLDYKDVRNNCVDFTWAALNDAGLHMRSRNRGSAIDNNYEGSLKPTHNMEDVKRILAPFPKSPLNQEREIPMSENRTRLQRLFSEDIPKNEKTPEYAGVEPKFVPKEKTQHADALPEGKDKYALMAKAYLETSPEDGVAAYPDLVHIHAKKVAVSTQLADMPEEGRAKILDRFDTIALKDISEGNITSMQTNSTINAHASNESALG